MTSVMNTSMQSEPEMRRSQESRKSVPYQDAGTTLNVPPQIGTGQRSNNLN